jgi:hypothetical protein
MFWNNFFKKRISQLILIRTEDKFMYDNSTINEIIELGGREWVSKDFSRHRIYFGYSFIYEAINLKLGHYDSAGNIM